MDRPSFGGVARWTAIDRTSYRVSWNGDRWSLKATPGAKYPWFLYNEHGVVQQINMTDLRAAQARCEFWLSVRDIYRGGNVGSKHTGEDDKQTDHVNKGSDGHTTESGTSK